MGHVTDTYNQVQDLGIEKLRNIYAAIGLSIRPKTKVGMMDTIKEILRAHGKNPEQVLTKEALLNGEATTYNPDMAHDQQLSTLRSSLRELVQEVQHNQ